MWFYKLSNSKKYSRLKKLCPLYVIATVLAYWKLEFWLASLIIIPQIILTLLELNSLKKKIEEEKNKIDK